MTVRTLTVAALAAASLATAAGPALATAPATRVTVADLPAASAFRTLDGSAGFHVADTSAGAGAMATCQSKGLDEYAPNASFSRTYDNGSGYHWGSVTIASFRDHRQAVAMQYAVTAQFDTCQRQLAAWGYVPVTRQVKRTITLAGGGTAILFLDNYRDPRGLLPNPAREHVAGGLLWSDGVAVVNTGTHVEVLAIQDWVKTPRTTTVLERDARNAAVTLR